MSAVVAITCPLLLPVPLPVVDAVLAAVALRVNAIAEAKAEIAVSVPGVLFDKASSPSALAGAVRF